MPTRSRSTVAESPAVCTEDTRSRSTVARSPAVCTQDTGSRSTVAKLPAVCTESASQWHALNLTTDVFGRDRCLNEDSEGLILKQDGLDVIISMSRCRLVLTESLSNARWIGCDRSDSSLQTYFQGIAVRHTMSRGCALRKLIFMRILMRRAAISLESGHFWNAGGRQAVLTVELTTMT